jgi:hypothetical protein
MTGTIGGDDRRANPLSKPMTTTLFCLWLSVGWHFFYEGRAKLLAPTWTAAPYLLLSRGIFSGLFNWLASSLGLVRAVDLLDIWGLMLIGLAVMLGCLSPRQCFQHRAAGALPSGAPTLDPNGVLHCPGVTLPAGQQERRRIGSPGHLPGLAFRHVVWIRPAAAQLARREGGKAGSRTACRESVGCFTQLAAPPRGAGRFGFRAPAGSVGLCHRGNTGGKSYTLSLA